MRRMIVAAAALAALATPASLFVVGGSTVAGAATPKSLVCSKVSGTDTSTVTISSCAVPKADAKLYASASGKASSLEKGGTITWTSSKKTTVLKLTVKSSTGCAVGDLTEKATGSVTGGTASTAITSKGQAVSLTVCINKSGAISLKPGTKADI
jgi:cysteine sulfinate desulfinase/cysteine desulfurase-like protein